MTREFTRVGVVGLGTMGAGIVEVFARNGVPVVAVEVSAAALDRGRANLTGSTDRAVSRGKLAEADRDALLGRVDFAVGLDALHSVDLVIEAVPERLDVKQRLFAELDRICHPQAILATNTSSLSVTEIAVSTGRPQQVVGVHFFNPAPVMKLVEIVRTVVTAADVVADVEALCARLGKVDVTIDDRAGFIANALLFGYLNQAVGMFEAGYATRADLDAAMKLGCGLPMGPLALLDLIGLDTAYEILETMYRRGGRNRRHAPVPLLRQMVTAGLLGRKTGRGFYTYERPGSSKVVPDELTPRPAQTGGVRAVGKVGVVGSGATAEGLVGILGDAGHPVVAVPAGADPSGLADVDLVVVASDTTTAARPVIEAAMATGRPADVVGLHFVQPPKAAPLVEIVRTVRTSAETVAAARALVADLGKTGVLCADRSGLVVDALLFPYLNDAVRMLEAGYSTVDDIDHAMKLGCGYPTGPFELLDAVGLDVALAVLRGVYREQREPGLAPAPLLENLVTAGYLGRESGRGFRAQPAAQG
ncbi:3-hydroxyacyl-CoA dehydrogenase family protein [Micromonospora radicis]|uniref:3-hydroxyacyl-CoA dehydrogenase family protein n=1 Tax=Micromonospora radicis TaxID=1894971 RepID=A0A418MRK3_9ACTN|nr:3-hydroxybutyryl-CoA dehydrogenase [Micromonospora radicis]RIV36562.1 3-hydroxyacyl-CoA dehydrogenase family protein [Micromonospora radicis]